MKKFGIIIIILLGYFSSSFPYSDFKGKLVKLKINSTIKFLSLHKSSAVPSYRYSLDLGELDPRYEGYTVRWNPQNTVKVYVNYSATESFISLVKRAIQIWNSITSAKLMYAGKSYTESMADKFIKQDINAEEAIYIIEDNSQKYLNEICGNDENLAGCSAPLYVCTSDQPTSCYIAYNIIVMESYQKSNTLSGWEIKREVYFLHYILHELGHSLGLGHPFEHIDDLFTPSVMSYAEYKATLYPSTEDIDVIFHLYGEKNNKGDPIFITTYYTPSFPPDFKVVNSIWWQDLYGKVFCINGGAFPYKVTGASLIKREKNAFCYQFENGAYITIESSDGQKISTFLNKINIAPKGDPNSPVSLKTASCQENPEIHVPYSYRISLTPKIKLNREDLKEQLFFYWAVVDEKGKLLLVEKLGETTPNSLKNDFIIYYIIPDFIYIDGLTGCFYVYIGYFAKEDNFSKVENLRCGYWKVCFEGPN